MCLKLLGRFDNFPVSIQGIARFTYPSSTQKLQSAIVQVLHTLNKHAIDMKTLTKASPANCLVNFEFGVADADTFNFLDEEELEKIKNVLKQQILPILDVYCVARYHITGANGKRKPLKFDYSMLRFAFHRENIELFLHHERGIQRIPLEDLVLFLKNKIDQELIDKQQISLTLKRLHTL